MSPTIRDATMLLTACLLYIAFTSGAGSACVLVEGGWVTADPVTTLCRSERQDMAGVSRAWSQPRLW